MITNPQPHRPGPHDGVGQRAEEPGDEEVLPSVDALDIEHVHGGGDEEPGTEGEAAQVALHRQALPPDGGGRYKMSALHLF